MGGTTSQDFKYALPTGEKKDGETHIYRAPSAINALFATTNTKTVQDIHVRNFKERPKKPYLGYRPIKSNGELMNQFDWHTYEDVEKTSKALGAGIFALELAPKVKEYKDYELQMVAYYSKNNDRVWMLDVACSLYNIATVPIYDTLGESSIKFVLDETSVTTLFLTVDLIGKIAPNIKKGLYKTLKTVVILDDFRLKDEAKQLEGVNWYSYSAILEAGKKKPLDLPEVKPENIYAFSYTSGTTGDPKGVMISHENIVTSTVSCLQYISVTEYVYLSYLPIAHIYEKLIAMAIAFRGGKYAMFGGNVLELKTDLGLLKPTIFASVPRLYNKFFDKITEGIKKLTGLKKTIVNNGIKAKLEKFRATGVVKHKLYDIPFASFRDILGGKVELMISGSAPISKEVQEMFTILMGAPLINGYGQTEGMGAEFLTASNERMVGVVGGPISSLEFKLLDIPDMEYSSLDKDETGKPSPRGEILVRGKPVFVGYYKQDEKYAETIDSDGWLHSGDIGKILPGNNCLMIIDRRKNVFKLSQGEYIAPDKLEQAYKNVKGVDDIFVYGDSLKACVVAILNVDKKILQEYAKELKVEGTYEELCANDEIRKYFLKLLEAHSKKVGFSGLERIKNLYIEPTLFNDLELITTTFKVKRHHAKQHFQQVIDKLYTGLD